MAGERLNLEEIINQAKQTLEGGNPDRAILLCQHIFKYFPRCLEATRVLGEAYTEKKLLDEADQLFVYVLASDPHDVLGYVDRGFIACERNQFEEAIVFYERALELDPNIEQLRSELLRLYKEQYGSGRAKLRLTRASLANHRLRDGFYAQAIDEYNAILRETPNRLDIQVGLLEAHWRNQDYPRAERLALDLLENHPYLIKANLILWHIYGVRRRQEKAAIYLDKAQALDPLHLVAERLFEDATTNDNALNYIAMLGTPTLPPPNWDKLESEAANALLLPNWVTADEATDRLLGLKGLDPNAEELADSQSTLKDLGGNDTNWLQRLLDESETEEKVEENKAEALADLDQLRQGGEEDSFDNLFEELSQPGFPVPDETSQTSEDLSEIFGGMEADHARFDPFDLEMGDDMAQNLEPMRFDPSVLLTETDAAPSPSPKGQPTIQFSLDDLDFDIPNLRVEDAPTFNPGSYGGTGLMDLFAEDDMEPFGLTEAEDEKESKAVAKPMPSLEAFDHKAINEKPANTGDLDDDSFLESLLSEPEQSGNYDFSLDLLDDEPAIIQEAAMAVPGKANPTSLEEHAFHKRDERGPIPDFVAGETPEPAVATEATEYDIVNFNELDDLLGEASPEFVQQTHPQDLGAAVESEAEIPGMGFNNQGADSTSAGETSASKEINDMPIKRGKPEEENDVFDWEKEELPDYLQPFAMDENEIEQFGLGTGNGPVADVSTSPARIRPRDQDTGGATPGDLPDWLNPAGNRTPPPPRPNMVDLSGGNRQAPPGDLPNWLDKTLEGQGQPNPSFLPLGDDFGLGDLQPFSPDDGDAFGGPSLSPPTPPPTFKQPPPAQPSRQPSQPTPFSPTERAFSEAPIMDDGGDLMPFSFDDLDSPGGSFAKPAPSQPSAPPRQPAPPQPSFNQPPAQSFDFGGDFDDLMPFNPTDDGDAAPPAPPRQAPPQQSFNQQQAAQPKQPPAPSPRSSFPTPGGRSTNANLGDFGDIEPFSLDFDEKPPTNPGRSNTPADINPFDLGNPQKSGFTDLGNMKLSDMDNIEPFNLGDFGAGEAKAPPHPSQLNQRAGSAPSFPDDLGNLDIEPFSFDSLDIPGLGNGPNSMRPDPNAYAPEPYFPTSGRRPRDLEPEIELEPGQARPFRKFSWLENRKKATDQSNRSKTMRDGEEDSESPFARMSRRKQQFESTLPPIEELKPLELEAEGVKYEEILSFEEIERRASLEEMAASGATAGPAEKSFALPELAANEPELSLNLDNAAFDLSLDESLGGTTPTQTMADFQASQPPNQDMPLDDFDLDMQPFDMADFGAEKPEFSLEHTPTKPEPFSLDFDEPSTQDDPFGLKIPEPPTMATSFDFSKELNPPEPFSFGETEPALDFGDKAEPNFGLEQHFSQEFGLDQVKKSEPEPFSFDNFEQPELDFGQDFEPKFTEPEPFSLDLGEASKTEPAIFSFDDLPEPDFDFGQTLEQKAPESELPTFDFGQAAKTEEPIFSFDDLDEPVLDFGEPAAPEQPLNFGLEQAEKVELDTFPWEKERTTEKPAFGSPDKESATEKPLFGSPDLGAPTAQPDFAEFGNDLDFFATDEKRVTPQPIRISDFAKSEPRESGLMSFEEASKAFGINLDEPVAEEPALPFEPDLPAFTLPVETAEPESAIEATKPEPVVEIFQPPMVPQVAEAVVKPEVAAVVPEKPISQPATANGDLSAYLKRVSDNPRDLSANLGLGNAYYERQDYGQAINYFATSLKVADKDTIGDIVNKLQNIATAQDANARFHRVLGDAYMKQGHYHWALSEYSKALEKGGTKK